MGIFRRIYTPDNNAGASQRTAHTHFLSPLTLHKSHEDRPAIKMGPSSAGACPPSLHLKKRKINPDMFTRPPPIITRFLDLHAVRSTYNSSPNPSSVFLPFDPIRSQYICPSRSHCLWRSHRSPVRHTALPHRITPISIIRSRYRTIPVLARRSLSLPRPWPPIWVHSPPTDTSHVAFGRRALTEAFVRGRRLEILPLILIGIEVLLLRLGMVRHPVFGRTWGIFNMAWHQK